jgi:SAM-dependent methyltransferase
LIASADVGRLDDPDLVRREYATLDRLERRRLGATASLSEPEEPLGTLLSAVAAARPQRVLDAGCGDGSIAALVAAPDVVCVDQSEASVAAARARGLHAAVADIAQLPFPSSSFDVVMSNWTLYHLADVDGGLREIKRVLHPGGRFVGAYNHPEHLAELWHAVGHVWRRVSFDAQTGEQVLRRHFQVVERRDTDGAVLWEDADALAVYLDAYREITGPLTPPRGPYPFRASRRNCVFVAY